jgi:NAD(P)-dependent dehydrogenase (short-subunit alcohol dehydrogenase family)
VVTDLYLDGCERVLQEIRDAGGVGDALRMNVCIEEEIRETMEKVRERFKRIDILVNNAGIYIQKEIEALAAEDIDRVISINLRGAILCIKYVLPTMKENNYGKIVNIASIAGFVGFPRSALHAATKGALVAMSRDLALDYGKYRININAIAPGVIETPLTADALQDETYRATLLQHIPYGRIGRPDDVVNGVAFLASDDSEYITGQTLVIDGGWISA